MAWRPLPGTEEPDPVRVGDALDRLVRSFGHGAIDDLRRISAAWPELVGPLLADQSQPISLRNGTLLVIIADPAWVTELRFHERRLLDTLEQLLPGRSPTRIAVQVRVEQR